MLGFFPIQKIPYKKIPYKKNVSVFPIQKIYYVVHTQKNCHTFFTMYFFPYKKLLCITRTKKLPYIFYYVFSPIQKITMYGNFFVCDFFVCALHSNFFVWEKH